MPTTDQEDLESYIEGTSRAGNKLERKFKASAPLMLKRLKDPATADKYHKRVSDPLTKKVYQARTSKLTESDVVNPMSEKGVQNYQTSTASESVQRKWLENGKEHREAAKKFKESKKIATTNAERVSNMTKNMEMQQDIKKKRLGI